MKITKRQLRRIIKEEKAKLLKESGTAGAMDAITVSSEVNEASERIAEQFFYVMVDLPTDAPDAFEGYAESEAQWHDQCTRAKDSLQKDLLEVINETINRVEMSLHGGDYFTGNR